MKKRIDGYEITVEKVVMCFASLTEKMWEMLVFFRSLKKERLESLTVLVVLCRCFSFSFGLFILNHPCLTCIRKKSKQGEKRSNKYTNTPVGLKVLRDF